MSSAAAFGRRVCIFPLYRHFSLVQRCVKDVVMLLQSGRKVLLRALLAVKRTLHRGDWVYVLCKLYVDPYARGAPELAPGMCSLNSAAGIPDRAAGMLWFLSFL